MANKSLKNVYESKGKGIYHAQKFCTQCWVLITGTSTNADNGARSDLGSKFSEHKKECHE